MKIVQHSLMIIRYKYTSDNLRVKSRALKINKTLHSPQFMLVISKKNASLAVNIV